MKKKYRLIFAFLFLSIGLGACTSCGSNAERALHDLYDVNVDLDDDGDYGDRGGYNPSFRGKKKTCPPHVDNHLPWNECDICGKHKVYW